METIPAIDLLIKFLPSLGVGSVVAIIVLLWKRSDDKRFEKTICNLADKMLLVIQKNTEANTVLRESVDLLVENLLEVSIKKSRTKRRKK